MSWISLPLRDYVVDISSPLRDYTVDISPLFRDYAVDISSLFRDYAVGESRGSGGWRFQVSAVVRSRAQGA